MSGAFFRIFLFNTSPKNETNKEDEIYAPSVPILITEYDSLIQRSAVCIFIRSFFTLVNKFKVLLV